jgi:spermidine synthase
MHTSLEASERLEQDASKLAGSVYRTLETVFPEVKVTAGSPLHFFASGRGASLSLDRETLYQRSVSSRTFFKTFQSLYFLDADELAPDKIAFTEQRLHSSGAPVNTVMRPVSCYYTLILWSRYSNSAIGAVLGQVKRLNKAFFVFLAIFLGVCAMASAVIWRRSTPESIARAGGWLAMAATGFAGVALELILLYVYQGLFGYVYSRMGFMVGLFMLGTVAGAWQIRWIETCGSVVVRRAVALGLLMMAALAVGVGGGLMSGVRSEWLLYGAMAAAGGIVGMQFVAVTRFLVVAGSGEAAAAGTVWLGDYWGSALGGLLAGVFLPVIFGIAVTCLILLAILLIGLLIFFLTSLTP